MLILFLMPTEETIFPPLLLLREGETQSYQLEEIINAEYTTVVCQVRTRIPA